MHCVRRGRIYTSIIIIITIVIIVIIIIIFIFIIIIHLLEEWMVEVAVSRSVW